MKDIIVERILKEAHYMIDNAATVRRTAPVFYVCKSTVYRDLTEKLPSIDQDLYEEILVLLQQNKEARAYRGGLANKLRYERRRKKII